MSRYIPANAETRDFPAAVVVAYCFEGKNGPAYVAYKGRQGKPARFFSFASLDGEHAKPGEAVRSIDGIGFLFPISKSGLCSINL